tara:strand:+ start:161 stop:457 length:297 start_codon:yes stop_codon:yes gene_type:complete
MHNNKGTFLKGTKMNKFANNVSIEEDPSFQAWLDAQEVADIRAMEEEQEALFNVRGMAMEKSLDDNEPSEEWDWEEVESDDGHRDLYDDLDKCDTVLE